jgi:hypothetical protein
METRTEWALALIAVVVAALVGCGSRGGRDPRDAPGCVLNAYRCDGDMLQVCQIDAAERRKTWWDVQNCVELGEELGETSVCLEQAGSSTAECAEVVGDGGMATDADAGYVTADCPRGEWRCHEGVVQACDQGAQGPGTAWWNVWVCSEQTDGEGRPLPCFESDAGLGAECGSGADGEGPDAGR